MGFFELVAVLQPSFIQGEFVVKTDNRVLEANEVLTRDVDKVLFVSKEVIYMGLLVLFLVNVYKEFFGSNYLGLRVVPDPSSRAREVGQDSTVEPSKHTSSKVSVIFQSPCTVVNVVLGPV